MRSDVKAPSIAPGPLLRLTIAAAAIATAVVVVSATLDSGRSHWAAALVALPLLVAAAVIARIAYPRLFVATATALGLMLVAVATGGLVALADDAQWAVAVHVAAAGASLAASLLALVLSFRGEPVPFGSVARLHHADEAADHVAAAPDRCCRDVRRRGRVAERLGVPRDDGRARARLRRLERAQPRDGRRHRQADGRAHRGPPGRVGPGCRATRTRVRRRPHGPLVRVARHDRERADGCAGARRRALLRRRLHGLPEALDRPEHRHRRRRRCDAAASSASRRRRGA